MHVLGNLITYGTIIISAIAYILFALYVIGSVIMAAAIYIKVVKSYISYRRDIKLTKNNLVLNIR